MDSQPENEIIPQPDLQALRHELRTPVNHIIGFGEMLLEDLGEDPGPFAPLEEVIAAGRACLAIMSDLLGPLDVQPSPEAIAQLAPRLAPHLELISEIGAALATLADRTGPAAFVGDLLKIADAAVYLGKVANGTIGPLAPSALGTAQSSIPALDAARPPLIDGRILIVDDNAMNREMLARRLERIGYHPDQANDGAAALAVMREHPYDLILLDLLMPELDGFGVLSAMKADPELQQVAVIVLSALDNTESVVRAVELGADDYLAKPFDPVLLKARIGACLFKKSLRDLERDYLHQIEEEKRRSDALLHVVIPLGVALVGERDFNLMLEKIVVEAQNLTRAEGGSLYLRTEDDRLQFMVARNTVLGIAIGGSTRQKVPFPPVRLYDEQTGAPLHNYVVAHTALTGQPINVPDAYNAQGYDFSGTREVDARNGYRTTSVLNIPLRDNTERVIGVLQLINARDEAGQVIPFDGPSEQMILSLGQLAAAALAAYARERQLQQEIRNLKIEIDEVKKQREVSAITGSHFFSDLQERARSMRSKSGGTPSSQGSPPPEKGIQRRSYTVGQQTIVTREQGPERGRVLLLIHGWSSSWYAMSPLMDALSDRYRCVAVDLPGYGDSPPLPVRANIPAYADLMVGLLEQISPGMPGIVIGHSMGGMTAVTMALRHPDRLERMILLCPTISGQLSFWINTFISPITMLERSKLASGVLSKLEPYMLNLTDRLMRPASFAQRSGITESDYHRLRADARRPGQGRVRAECFWAMRDNDLSGRVNQVSVPTLVIWGLEDNTVPLGDASLLADEWPSAELRLLPKAGHWPQFETPDITRKAVRSFLSTPIKLLKGQLV